MPKAVERDRLELALELALGGVLWSSKSWSHPDTTHAFARAEQLAEKLGETYQLVVVQRGSVISALGSGQFRLAHKFAERMLLAAERDGGRASLCAAHVLLGQALTWRAQYVEAQKHLELASSYYDEDDPSDLALTGLDGRALAAIVVLLLGFPDRARQFMQVGLRQAEHRDDPFFLSCAHVGRNVLRTSPRLGRYP